MFVSGNARADYQAIGGYSRYGFCYENDVSNNLQSALDNLLEWIGEGRRLSEATPKQKALVKFAVRQGYVDQTRIRNDFILNPTGRMP